MGRRNEQEYTYGGRCKPLDVERLRGEMPRVGDKLIRRMEGGSTNLGVIRPSKVTVTYVNKEHLWYEVQFPSGIRQGYKFPQLP